MRSNGISRSLPPFCAGRVVLGTVDREGDADPAEDDFGLLAPRPHHLRRLLGEPAVVAAVVLAHRAVRGPHLVESGLHAAEGSKVRATDERSARFQCGGGAIGWCQ